jgi:hypothetical protein
MPRFKRFYDPIVLPDGRELPMLRDAAEYIMRWPKAEYDAADRQAASSSKGHHQHHCGSRNENHSLNFVLAPHDGHQLP